MVDKTGDRPQLSPADPTETDADARPMSPPQPPRASHRLAQILDAASLLFQGNGFHETTMQEVATRAGMSVGLIYRYAENKEAVLLLVLAENLAVHARELRVAMDAFTDPVERLVAGFAAYCGMVDSRRDAVLLAYRESKTLSRPSRESIKQLEQGINAILVTEIRAAVAAGLMVPVDAPLVAHDLTVLAQAWALKRWALPPHQTIDRYVAFHTSLFLRSLIVDSRKADYRHLVDTNVLGPAS